MRPACRPAAQLLRYGGGTKNLHDPIAEPATNKQSKGNLMRKYLWIPAAALSALLGTACMGMHDDGTRSGGMRSGGMGSSSDMGSGGMGSAGGTGSSSGGGSVSPSDPKRGTGGS